MAVGGRTMNTINSGMTNTLIWLSSQRRI